MCPLYRTALPRPLWLVVMIAMALASCANTTPRLGAPSAIHALGSPKMTETKVGSLASWDTQGAGPTLVLWPSIFTEHSIYEVLVSRLKSRYRIILIDGPGHGSSGSPPEAGFTMKDCAVALKAVLDSRGITRAVIGGTSWGGLVATEFALNYPQSTLAMIAINTPFLVPTDGPGTVDKMITLASKYVLNTSLFAWGVSRNFFLPGTREADGSMMKSFRQHLADADAKSLSISIRAVMLERSSMLPQLSEVGTPALVIAGRQDAMFPLETQQLAASKIAGSKFVVLNTQHISVVDDPVGVANALDEFLTQLPGIH